MDFSDRQLLYFLEILALLMAIVALLNWLNRKHGGFAKGWAGAIFIAFCWFAALAMIVLKLKV